jgi:hypothetical protein
MGYSTPQKGNFSGNLHFSIFQGLLAKEWYHVGKFLRSRKLHFFWKSTSLTTCLDISDHETIMDLGIHPYFHLSKHGYITLLLSLLENFDTYFWHQKSLMTTKVQLISISWTVSRFSNPTNTWPQLKDTSAGNHFFLVQNHSRVFRWRFSLPETTPLIPGWWALRLQPSDLVRGPGILGESEGVAIGRTHDVWLLSMVQ